jgi:hypothetical protein
MAGQDQDSTSAFNKWLARAVNWKEAASWLLGLFAVLGGLGSQVAALTQYGWAAVAIVALVLGSVAFFFVMGGMAIWRAYKPHRDLSTDERQRLEQFEAVPVLDHAPIAYDDTALRGEIAELNAVIEVGLETVRKEAIGLVETVISARIGEGLQFDTVAETFKASDTRAGHMAVLLDKRCDDISKAVDALAGGMAATDNALFEKIGEEKTRINAIIDDNNRTNVRLETLESEVKDLKTATAKVPAALHAIYQREVITRIAGLIEMLASEMYDGFHNGETYDEQRWLGWEEAHGKWEAAVRGWIENGGRWYAPAVDARVYLVDDEKYGQHWGVRDAQFPDTERLSRSEAVRRFKKFRIIHTQWREVREEVDRGIVQVAFVGLTPEEVRRRPGDGR